jgi:hypothetical protein
MNLAPVVAVTAKFLERESLNPAAPLGLIHRTCFIAKIRTPKAQ